MICERMTHEVADIATIVQNKTDKYENNPTSTTKRNVANLSSHILIEILCSLWLGTDGVHTSASTGASFVMGPLYGLTATRDAQTLGGGDIVWLY